MTVTCPRCGAKREAISLTERRIAKLRAEALTYREIGQRLRLKETYIRTTFTRMAHRLGLTQFQLGMYWSCELFQIGLKEMGFLPK